MTAVTSAIVGAVESASGESNRVIPRLRLLVVVSISKLVDCPYYLAIGTEENN